MGLRTPLVVVAETEEEAAEADTNCDSARLNEFMENPNLLLVVLSKNPVPSSFRKLGFKFKFDGFKNLNVEGTDSDEHLE